MSKRSHHEEKPEPAIGEPETAEAAQTAASAEIEELKSQLDARDKEIAELKDKYLRALAETENTRKRMRQQSEEGVRRERETLLRDLLPVIDNLERAAEAARGGGNGKSIVDGIDAVLKIAHDYLRSHGVTPQTAIGQQFDPGLHEAVAMLDSPHHEPNTVMEEHHRGYLVGDRVLRPARVSVAKAIEPKPADADGPDPNDVENE